MDDNKILIIEIIIVLLIIALSVCMGVIYNDILIVVIELLVGINIFLVIRYIAPRISTEDVPKSLLSVKLDEEIEKRKKIYLIESTFVSSIYITLINIFKIFSLDMLVINIYLFENKSVNDLIISIISYLLLTILTFIIELGFGEYLYKRGKLNG